MSETPAASPAASAPPPTPTPAPTAVGAVPATAAPTTVPPIPAPAQPVKFIAKPMKIGVVPFLNAQALVWDMQKHHQVFPVAPSEMGKLLKEGRLDVALAPIVVKFFNPELQVVPIAAIGSKGPVKSVRLLGNSPWQNTTRLFVDSRSQTSVLLARLLLKKWYGVKGLEVKPVDMLSFKPNQTKPWEATLQFGDIALESAPTGMTVMDLGEEWSLRTQKPFIFAVWLARNVAVAR